jgi:hypothetical protein
MENLRKKNQTKTLEIKSLYSDKIAVEAHCRKVEEVEDRISEFEDNIEIKVKKKKEKQKKS